MQVYTLTPKQRQLIAAQDLPSRLPLDSFAIYTLTDPSNRLIRYVGMTNTPRYRLVLHLKRIPFVGAKSVWLRSLHASELVPTMTLVETVRDEQAAAKREANGIRRLLEQGMPLVNKVARELGKGVDQPPNEQVDCATQRAAENPARQELT